MPRNVVLLVLDCVRRDTGAAELSLLADRADRSVPARAAASWSVPSHGSMLTGRLPHQHGVHVDNFDYTTIGRTFLDDLPHRTVGVSANSYASSTFGFDTHFDYFRDVRSNRYFGDALDVNDFLSSDTGFLRAVLGNDRPLRSAANVGYLGLKHLTQRLPIPALIDEGMRRELAALEREATSEPFFMFANVMEAHRPFFQHVGYAEKVAPYRWTSRSVGKWEINTADDPEATYGDYLDTYRALYRQSLGYMDRHLDRFLDTIDELTDGETTVVVTADHGEGLARPEDDGIIDHTGLFTDSVLNVPFLVFDPPAGFDPDFVSHLDLPELLTAFAHGEAPDLDREWAPSETIGALSTPEENAAWWDRTCRSIWTPEESHVWDSVSDTPAPAAAAPYFDVPVDACRGEASHDFDDATRAQLENLGYL